MVAAASSPSESHLDYIFSFIHTETIKDSVKTVLIFTLEKDVAKDGEDVNKNNSKKESEEDGPKVPVRQTKSKLVVNIQQPGNKRLQFCY